MTESMKSLLIEQSAIRIRAGIIAQIGDDHRLNPEEKDDPNAMDTLGTLIDKLITVDMKMWWNQEQLYAIRRMSASDFTERYEGSLDELHGVIKRCCDLNVQRSRLMDAIDVHFSEVVSGDREAHVNSQNKTY